MAWLEQVPNMFPLAHSLTSANMNGIRDSLLELFAAKATAAGQLAYADATNNIDMLNILNNGLLRAGANAPEWEAVLDLWLTHGQHRRCTSAKGRGHTPSLPKP